MSWDGTLWKTSVEEASRQLEVLVKNDISKNSVKFLLGGCAVASSNSNCKPQKIGCTNLVSEEAFKRLSCFMKDLVFEDGVGIVEYGKQVDLRREHTIPTKVVLSEVYRLHASGELCQAKLCEIIKKCGFAVLTREESALLDSRKIGLKQRMPEGWTWKTGDPLARLKSVGIKMHQFQTST